MFFLLVSNLHKQVESNFDICTDASQASLVSYLHYCLTTELIHMTSCLMSSVIKYMFPIFVSFLSFNRPTLAPVINSPNSLSVSDSYIITALSEGLRRSEKQLVTLHQANSHPEFIHPPDIGRYTITELAFSILGGSHVNAIYLSDII